MADVTITGLPNASALTGAERIPMDQAGVTVDAAASAVAALATKATVGLGSVDNTSDLNKPISTATQAALDTKAATAGTLTQFAATTSAQLAGVVSDETGTGPLVFANSPTLVAPALGTPSSVNLTNATGLPLATGTAGVLPVASGGTGTAAPGLVAGANITITGTWPSQTISSSGGGGGGGGSGTVTSVGLVAPTGFSVTGSPVTTSGNITLAFAAGYSLPLDTSQANWNTAFTERLRWDGGSTGLDATTGRASLGLGSLATQSGTFSGTSSGTNTGDNAVNTLYSGLVSNANHTGDATGSTVLTLATVNANVGTFGSATAAGVVTVNAKGLVTGASSATITPAVGSITGLGTGVATALAANVGSAGALVVLGGVGGTPSAIALSNGTGLPLATGVTGILPVASGGTGTATPGLVQGANVTISGAWPNQTISASVTGGGGGDALVSQPLSQFAATTSAQLRGVISDETGTGLLYFQGGSLGTPSSATLTNATGLPLATGVTGILPVASGGTGTASPGLLQGANITISGTWPNQTISATGGGSFDPASPGAIGGTTAAAGSFTALSASTSLLLPNTAGAAAGHLYRVTDQLRYRDSGNVEQVVLYGGGNLANLGSTSTARANLGLTATATATPAGGLSIQSGNLVPSDVIKLVVSNKGETATAATNYVETTVQRACTVTGAFWELAPSATGSSSSQAMLYARRSGTKTNLLSANASLASSAILTDASANLTGTLTLAAGDTVGVDLVSVGTGSSGHIFTLVIRYS